MVAGEGSGVREGIPFKVEEIMVCLHVVGVIRKKVCSSVKWGK